MRPEIAAGILDDAIGRYEHLLSRLTSADRRLEARVARFAGSSPVQCEGKDGEPRPIPSGVTARLFDLGQQLHVQMEAIEEKLERLEQL